MKRLVSLFAVGLCCCLMAFNAFAATGTTETPVPTETEASSQGQDGTQDKVYGVINATNVIVRTGTTRDTDKICSLSKGTTVEVVPNSQVDNPDEFGPRIQISYQGTVGYVAQKYVTIVENVEGWYLLSTATTQASKNINRDTNISIASSYINGTILKPNEEFNFWNIVGKCTYDKGYQDATVYSNGKVTTGIGGGICQVSSTINISAKKAGIATNARKHSLPVSYARREDEATVSYGNVNFKFTNTTGRTIMLVMKSGEGACTCEIWAATNE